MSEVECNCEFDYIKWRHGGRDCSRHGLLSSVQIINYTNCLLLAYLIALHNWLYVFICEANVLTYLTPWWFITRKSSSRRVTNLDDLKLYFTLLYNHHNEIDKLKFVRYGFIMITSSVLNSLSLLISSLLSFNIIFSPLIDKSSTTKYHLCVIYL